MSATTNKPDKDTAFVVLDQEEADRQYQASHDVLEKIRRQSREARARLIEAIMCDRKDVLSEKDISKIQEKLAVFLEVQNRLGTAFFEDNNCFARLLGSIAVGPSD